MASLLSKGLNFIPTPQIPSTEQLTEDYCKFENSMRIKHFFRNRPYQQPHPFKSRSNWQAPKINQTIENFLEKTKQSIFTLEPTPKEHSNLSPKEMQALQQLKHNQDIVIKNADKGNGIVIENTTDYKLNGLRHLQNKNIYQELEADPTQVIAQEINNSIESLHEAGYIDDTTKEFLTLHLPVRSQRIYFLKKLHKTPHGLRPIVSGINGPTEKISAFIDYFLKPTLSTIPSLLNNTQELLEILTNITIPENSTLVTIDVSNLYLNIPQDEGTDASLDMLTSTNNLPLPKEHLRQLFDFVLKENIFIFDDRTFKQIQGTAMGTKMAPSYANIFMHTLEHKFIQEQTIKPFLWKRYIDDILMIWTSNTSQLQNFLQKLNSFHKTIKFTWEISNSSINFLDVTIFKGKKFNSCNKLDFRTYYKPTNTFQYLHHQSYHTKATKKAVIIGEAKRLKRTNSSNETFQQNLSNLKRQLSLRGYPQSLISKALEAKGRTKSSNPLVMTTSLSSQTKSITTKLRKNWHLIQNDQELSHIFTSPPMATFRKSKTIANHLVRAKLPGNPPPQHETYTPAPSIRIPSRTPTCNRWNCMTCPKLLPLQQLKGYPLHQSLNCKSKNVIYGIQCNICKKLYIGQTSKQLNLRINNHRTAARRQTNWPIYRHFLTKNHDFDRDHRIIIIEATTKNNLLHREKLWIRRLNTTLPNGLNSIYSL